MADVQYHPLGTLSAPADWPVPKSVELAPKSVFAHFDGTNAAGSYLPTLQIISDAGTVAAEIPVSSEVAAGDSADVTFAPFLRASGVPLGTGAPVIAVASGSASVAPNTFTVIPFNYLATNSPTVLGTGDVNGAIHNTSGDTYLVANGSGFLQVTATLITTNNDDVEMFPSRGVSFFGDAQIGGSLSPAAIATASTFHGDEIVLWNQHSEWIPGMSNWSITVKQFGAGNNTYQGSIFGSFWPDNPNDFPAIVY